MKKTLLLLPILLCACQSVRTVYDENGNVVEERDGANITDLQSHLEGQWDSSFSEQKGEHGVPTAQSHKVSSFQKDLDASKRMDKEYSTTVFGDSSKSSNLRSKMASGIRDSQYAEATSSYSITKSAPYGTEMRPDFMNETHGISHSTRYADGTARSSLEDSAPLSIRDRIYSTESDIYSVDETSNYVEHRRNKTEQPTIIDFRDYAQKFGKKRAPEFHQ